jgi:hypothetical protein
MGTRSIRGKGCGLILEGVYDIEIVYVTMPLEVMNLGEIRLAAEFKISPGIVVGQFQRLTEKWYYFNGLKRRIERVSTNSASW